LVTYFCGSFGSFFFLPAFFVATTFVFFAALPFGESSPAANGSGDGRLKAFCGN
jgi:hypothetical protein